MVNPVNPINPIGPISGSSTSSQSSGPDFKKVLTDAINTVNSTVEKADQMTADFATGKTSDIHAVIIQAEKADIMLQLTTDITNKIVNAYEEIMRMQI
ncbi:flagellar hook-basal body complex protein FliE [Athalassotoga saccharophila]|uniref:flagellar hook-basal body complex protein FliE n=1 Tax=Athalassotoga saccharophila TaxID=1441386 RepID=UPI001379A066|nr:flagellar hook-basal body complex protein FliE [Athalassotoga saccharophila]BBJ27746.1 flagellar hook-basal body complex protein FliE [Athalassotoga saccharophila]